MGAQLQLLAGVKRLRGDTVTVGEIERLLFLVKLQLCATVGVSPVRRREGCVASVGRQVGTCRCSRSSHLADATLRAGPLTTILS